MTKCSQCGQSFPASVKLCPSDGAVLEHDDSVESQIGEVLDGKYRLDAFLSRGGMGAVYKATHIMLGRTVAVKLISPEYVTSAEAVRRFQREARAATSLNHPNIVNVYDLGQTSQGTLYIAMEFVDGPSLKAVITSGGPMAPARLVPLLRQVSSALAVAHRHNIVHRDLKPQNIMLARTEDGRELVKLVDFGIAKTYDEATQLTAAGAAMGTPQYMSPEQAEGLTVDGRSDLYSLGVVLYEMLSGEVPFNDKSATAIIIKHMKEAPQPPSVKNPTAKISPVLEAIALRCLEKEPSERFQTAEEFAAALESAEAPGIAEAMQPTIAVGQATTRRIVEAPVPAPPRALSETRPTVPRPSAAEGVVARPASNKAVVGLLVAAILVAAVGAFYFSRQSAREDSAQGSGASEPPAAVQASANQDQSSTNSPPPAVPVGAASALPASALSPAETAATGRGRVSSGDTSRGAGASGGAPTASANSVTANPATSTAVVARPDLRSAGGSPAPTPPRNADAPGQATPTAFPENPVVYFHCDGPPEICSALRTAVEEALDSGGLTAVRTAARADIDVMARVEGLEQAIDRQFQTTFAVRTYAIEVSAETTRTNEIVSMAPVSNLSFDPQYGSARIAERARLVAGDIVERVKAFVNKKRAPR